MPNQTEIKKDVENRMLKVVEAFKKELSKLRTGRAHPSLLEHIKVDYYGNETPLNQVASVTISDARTLSVTPWEKSMVQVIEKAIMNSGLGLNPRTTTGLVIHVPLPPLTEERRKNLVKLARSKTEESRIAVRNVRRDTNSSTKELVKNKEITEDDARKVEKIVQEITDKSISIIDESLASKETELMEI